MMQFKSVLYNTFLQRVWHIFGRLKNHHVFIFFFAIIPAKIPERRDHGPGQNRVIPAPAKNPILVDYCLGQRKNIDLDTDIESRY